MKFASKTRAFGTLWGPLAVAAVLGGTTSLASAQVTLACPTPTSTGVTANLSTAAGTWETSGDGGAWTPAVAYFLGAPWIQTPPATWIGANTGPNFTNVAYRVRVDASNPYVDLASATVTYNYRVDNQVVGASFNATPLTFDGTTFNSATPYTLPAPLAVTLTRNASNLLNFNTTNAGNPWGFVANVTLTYNCALPAAAPVPVDAPWALITLGGLMLAGVAAARRRKPR